MSALVSLWSRCVQLLQRRVDPEHMQTKQFISRTVPKRAKDISQLHSRKEQSLSLRLKFPRFSVAQFLRRQQGQKYCTVDILR